ncbi:dnaJ homolog subfamily C member 10-like [Gigantopelta aegis]|uniref:dnaJ homolog subfamily C member 10-like n=1 Tax=Gigantopelta aegis TaxID=1735272 RepID=UPI001B8897BC|nr:dnaJ homolog subfamily C member 10-like [Gigantopelta aegis]
MKYFSFDVYMQIYSSSNYIHFVRDLFLIAVVLFDCCVAGGDDYYELLGVPRSASSKDIRKAFKQMAVKHHPDKNKDDPKAHEKFLKYSRAYEVLKDEDLRKKYDKYGEDGLKDDHEQGRHYESWQWYQENFGIYDDDPEIITLSRSDFGFSPEQGGQLTPSPCPLLPDECRIWYQCGYTYVSCLSSISVDTQMSAVCPVSVWIHKCQLFVQYQCGYTNVSCLSSIIVDAQMLAVCPVTYQCGYTNVSCLSSISVSCLSSISVDTQMLAVCPVSVWIHKCYLFVQYQCGYTDVSCLSSISVDTHIALKEIRIVMLGKPGSGKSTTGNSILGSNDFKNSCSSKGQARKCSKARREHDDRSVTAVDTLGFCDTRRSESDIANEWCPPCMRLLPEFRKAAKSFGERVNFGTVDCTIHRNLCNVYNIHSYPTTIMYNQSTPHHYQGHHSADHIVEFLKDTLSPPVLSLNMASFGREVVDKNVDDVWLIDFYAPWCGPCQQLAPEWSRLAKMVKNTKNIHVAKVDCVQNHDLCAQQNVNSYPSMRLYPSGSTGTGTFFVYNGWHRDAHALRAWAYEFLPSKVHALTSSDFQTILHGREPWIVDFYAPWCDHCQVFRPEFERVAENIEGIAKAGKVNCDEEQWACQQAGIRAFPSVRFYSGTHSDQSPQDAYGWDINSQNAEAIISYVKTNSQKKIKQSGDHDEL